MAYQYSKKLRLPFDEVVNRLNDALRVQGFSMVSALDVRDNFQKTLGVKFRNYTILTVCIPELCYKAISLESQIGLVLPCNVVVQEHENGQMEVSAMNPMETLDANVKTPSLEVVSKEISNRLRTAVDGLNVNQSSFSFSYN